MNIIELNEISRQFGKLSVLNSLSLSLEKGEVLGLFGHNGAGKTTTMKMILGLLKPSSGSIRVFGENPTDSNFNHFKYRIGFLPENVSFYHQLTGIEVLQFFAKLKRVSKTRCNELLEQVGLTDASTRKVKTYSKGMKQRLGLAQAILTEPSLLLLDEPTVGLDPIATQDFYHIVDDLKNNGCSIILCSHVLPGVEKHIDKIAILRKGQLAAYGNIEKLREQTLLPTKIKFSGCFDIEELSKQVKIEIQTHNNGSFSLFVDSKTKLQTVKTLLQQPGVQDLDTLPPNLEQLYYHFATDAQPDLQSTEKTFHHGKPSSTEDEVISLHQGEKS